MSVTVVVLTAAGFEVEVEVEVDAALAALPVWPMYVGLRHPEDGLESWACWMSFPCSAAKAGHRAEKRMRNCGTIFLRMRSFTGALERASE